MMDTALEFTRESLPFILTLLLGWLYTNLSKTGDPADISNQLKVNVAVLAGVLLGIALMFYESKDVTVWPDYKTWVKYIIVGFLVGTSAIGLNQLQKNRPKATSAEAQKRVDILVKEEKRV
jgi:DMSO reductase anchor subunit